MGDILRRKQRIRAYLQAKEARTAARAAGVSRAADSSAQHPLLALQRSIGNRALLRLLQRQHLAVPENSPERDPGQRTASQATMLARSRGGDFSRTSNLSGRGLLLTRELSHVLRQAQTRPVLQRNIVVGGNPYTPTAEYYDHLTHNFGPAMKEFVQQMDNGGKPPTFTFSSYEQMGNEVRIRANAIKGIEEVHKGCCAYYDSANPPYLNSTYWDHIGSGVNFKLKAPLPSGKKPSDAIEAIFAPGAGTRLECMSMTVAIQYFAMLKGLGAAKFNAKFPAGIEISAVSAQPLWVAPDKKYNLITVSSKSEILPGDWVYFKNFKDYTTRVPGGYWQGENAICLGGGKFRGFGVAERTETELNRELVDRYNNEATPHLTKTVDDLIHDGGGLLLSPVIRPIISTVAP
ncbi:MAG: hypothetical protein WCA49_10335 [Candidatus Sulfotelmatobacter sp.]